MSSPEPDLRLERRWKRRINGNLCYKQNPRQRGSIDLDKDRGGNDDAVDYEDPDYKMFLRNLKVRGSSYALVDDHEELLYELDDCLPAIQIGENATSENDFRCARPVLETSSCGGEEEYARFLNPGLGECDHGERGYTELVNRYTGGKNTPIEEDIRRQRPVRETSNDDDERDYLELVNWDTGGKNMPVEEDVQTQIPILETLDDDDDDVPTASCGEEEEYTRFLNPGLGACDHGDPVNLFGDGMGRRTNTRPVSGCDEGEDCSKSDDVCKDYLEFLDLLESGGVDKFGEDEEICEVDSDVVFIEKGLHFDEESSPFVSARPSHVIDVETYCPGKDYTASHSRFKKELLEFLKEPYDSKQHRELERDFECKKPQLEDRKLRGKTKTYESTDKLGKSYLNQHSDLAELIKLAKNDNHKSLNLLRGFFFWIKNIAQVGAFKPWNDPSILEVLPEK